MLEVSEAVAWLASFGRQAELAATEMDGKEMLRRSLHA
jgi:hypothetical protein